MERLYRRILSELLDEIVTGRIGAGEWLPRVDDIAARHACSPAAVREAIRALEERRVVEVHAGQGQEVLRRDRWMVLDRDVAEATLLRHGDKSLLREAVAFVRAIEPHAALIAAERARDGDIALLAQILGQMRAWSGGVNGAASGARFAEAEAEFHRAFVLMARNRFLDSALEQLYPIIATMRRRRAPARDGSVVMLHERIVSALADRDARAAAGAAEEYWRHVASWLRV